MYSLQYTVYIYPCNIYISSTRSIDRQIDRCIELKCAYASSRSSCRFGISDKFFVLASDAVQMVVMEIVPLVKKGRDSTKSSWGVKKMGDLYNPT